MVQNIIPVSEFRQKASQVIKQVLAGAQVVCLTQHGRPKVALLDYQHYLAMLAELESLREGRGQDLVQPVGELNFWAATGVAVDVQISAREARQIVNREMVPQMSTGLGTREPNLMLREGQARWRVPLTLSLPTLGDLGEIGVVEVDARQGAIVTNYQDRQRMIQHAQRLYAGATLSTG